MRELESAGTCGCCEGVTRETPAAIENRPGLSAIAYRAGTHGSFKRSMLAALSSTERPALAALGARTDDDFSIALLDAWATTADVLTFYQERIANECHLGTATERRSILELARLIGYELKPGVAAFTRLAFTVENLPGAPLEVAVEAGTKVQSVPGPGEKAQTFETIEGIVARRDWSAIRPQTKKKKPPIKGDTSIYLKGLVSNLKVGDVLLFVGAERDAKADNENWDVRRVAKVELENERQRTLLQWDHPLGSDSPFKNPPADSRLYLLRLHGNLFGYNAPTFKALPSTTRTDLVGSKNVNDSEWPGFKVHEIAGAKNSGDPEIEVDGAHPEIVAGGWLVLAEGVNYELYRVLDAYEHGLTKFAMSGKATHVKLDGEHVDYFDNHVRDAAVFAADELLSIDDQPITSPLTDRIPLETPVDGLEKGLYISVSGKVAPAKKEDPVLSELALIEAIDASDPAHPVLVLSDPLARNYQRDTVTICANVAAATHGETVREVLGNGDASRPNQRFVLRQSPMTFIGSDDPSGAKSTLALYANDMLWREVPALYGAGSDERVFVTRRDEAGVTTIQGGDGIEGARFPSGQTNMRAVYRAGLGSAGNVRAGQLTSLLSRPLGLTGAVNPVAAGGGQDPEKLEDARLNAPRTVLTLDRVVSLRDYQAFARAFAGISKALATWTWNGLQRTVFVTVAGDAGASVEEGTDLYDRLLSALQRAGSPKIAVRIGNYQKMPFQVGVRAQIAPDRDPAIVLAEIEKRLRDAFSFEARALGQSVTHSEITALVQKVPGVNANRIVALYRSDDINPGALRERLSAEAPRAGDAATVLGAELLMLDSGPLAEIGEME